MSQCEVLFCWVSITPPPPGLPRTPHTPTGPLLTTTPWTNTPWFIITRWPGPYWCRPVSFGRDLSARGAAISTRRSASGPLAMHSTSVRGIVWRRQQAPWNRHRYQAPLSARTYIWRERVSWTAGWTLSGPLSAPAVGPTFPLSAPASSGPWRAATPRPPPGWGTHRYFVARLVPGRHGHRGGGLGGRLLRLEKKNINMREGNGYSCGDRTQCPPPRISFMHGRRLGNFKHTAEKEMYNSLLDHFAGERFFLFSTNPAKYKRCGISRGKT